MYPFSSQIFLAPKSLKIQRSILQYRIIRYCDIAVAMMLILAKILLRHSHSRIIRYRRANRRLSSYLNKPQWEKASTAVLNSPPQAWQSTKFAQVAGAPAPTRLSRCPPQLKIQMPWFLSGHFSPDSSLISK